MTKTRRRFVTRFEPKFPTGRIVGTPAALAAIEAAGEHPIQYLAKHVHLEQGDLDDQDHATNARGLAMGGRILSAFTLPTKVKVWVITEADRSVTTILLPEDY